MATEKDSAKTLSEAIAELEKYANGKSADAKEMLQNLRPHLEKLKDSVSHEATEAKQKAEEKIKENPLMALGIVAIIALIIGWLLGHSKRD